MRIAFDVSGFEKDLREGVQAAVDFAKHNPDIRLILVGDKPAIEQLLPRQHRLEVVHASQTITMDDGIGALRSKSDASMVVAVSMVQDGKADGVVSAGSTAPFVAACNIFLGTIPGIRRAAFMPWLPSANPGGTYILDVGANKESSASDLLQFAQMGSICSRLLAKKENPVVRMLNIGTEANKGLELHGEAAQLMQQASGLNFRGFIESRELLGDGTDVIVCDGYSGNIALKSMEGAMRTLLKFLLKAYKSPSGWLGGLFSLPVLLKAKKRFDYRNNAGALVVGLNKVAVKTHGSADYAQFMSTLRMCKECIACDIVAAIRKQLSVGA